MYRIRNFEVASFLQPQNIATLVTVGAPDHTVVWLAGVGYFAMFIAMCLEGPLVTAAAGFAAALGYFNIWIVLGLAILGDLIPDVIYFTLGYYSRTAIIERYGHRIGLSQERLQYLDELVKTHPMRALVLIKATPGIAVPGLALVGATRMPLRKYATLCSLFIVPKVIIFAGIGYYFGTAYEMVSTYVLNASYVIALGILVVLGVWWLYIKTSKVISEGIKKK